MTTGEAIAEIRRIGRTCRGPKLLTAEQQRPLLAQLATDLPGLIPRIASYRRMLRLAPEFREELAAETLENAQAQETAVPTIHAQTQEVIQSWAIRTIRASAADQGAACGYDFNEVVLCYPFDGQEREYRCPRCGLRGTFRSPHYDIAG